jgi:hypothetical protein
MTVFRFRRAEIAGFFLRSVASIPEMRQKCDRLQAFLGASPIYLGERVARSDKKRSEERKKRALRCHATLCERADSLKALDSVAGYLENGSF